LQVKKLFNSVKNKEFIIHSYMWNIHKQMGSKGEGWVAHLLPIFWSYHTTPQSSTNYGPKQNSIGPIARWPNFPTHIIEIQSLVGKINEWRHITWATP
jgi:hypothetical protein